MTTTTTRIEFRNLGAARAAQNASRTGRLFFVVALEGGYVIAPMGTKLRRAEQLGRVVANGMR